MATKKMVEASLYDIHSNLVRRLFLKPPIPRHIKINRPVLYDIAVLDDDDTINYYTFNLECWSHEFALYVCEEDVLLEDISE